MKKISLLLIAMIFATGISQALVYNKRLYGIAKIPGQVIDLGVQIIECSDNPDETFMIVGSEYYENIKCVETESNGKKIYTVKGDSKEEVVLTSTDGGSTYEGTINYNGNNLQVWLIDIPLQEFNYYKTDEDLLNALESDSYNAYLSFWMGGKNMVTIGEFIFDPKTKTFSVKFDNSAVQNVFGKMKGKYGIRQFTNNSGELSRYVYLVDASGKRIEASPQGKNANMLFDLGNAGPLEQVSLRLFR